MIKPKPKIQVALLVLVLFIGLLLTAWILTANAAKLYLASLLIITGVAGLMRDHSKFTKSLYRATLWFWLVFLISFVAVFIVIGVSLNNSDFMNIQF